MKELPTVFTVGNGLAGLLALLYIIDGGDGLVIASMLIVIGVILDGADGALARKLGTSSEFGRKLDGICDMVTFCFAPAMLLYRSYYNAGASSLTYPGNLFVVIGTVFVAGMGIIRLSLQEPVHDRFRGLPTAALALTLISIIRLDGPEIFAVGGALLLSPLMLLDIKYPKIPDRLLVLPGMVMMFMLALLTFKYLELMPMIMVQRLFIVPLALLLGYDLVPLMKR